MKTLVLDKSALQAMPPGDLERQRKEFDFLLIDVLLHEIITEDLNLCDGMSPEELERRHGSVDSNLSKVLTEAGNRWIDNVTALKYELENGQSAKFCPDKIRVPILSSRDLFANRHRFQFMEYEEPLGKLSTFTHLQTEQELLDTITKMGDRGKFFIWLDNHLSDGAVVRNVKERAFFGFKELAESRGITVSPNFVPAREWLSLGIEIASSAFFFLKWFAWGDKQPEPSKPANPFFDVVYVAYISIADGFLGCERDQLDLAWACWPEKRDSIYIYEERTRAVHPYLPNWNF